MKPSLLVVVNAILALRESETGILNTPVISSEPKLPISTFIPPSYSDVGLAVMTLIAPTTAFLPNKVPWGPFNTSTRSTSKKPISAKADELESWPLVATTTAPTTAAPTP